MGSVCVSSCRCCVLVSVVHPVGILSAVFCVICSLLMFVSDASAGHMMETQLSMGLVMLRGSFPFVFAMLLMSVLSICIVLRAFVVVISMCLLYVSLGLSVSPNIFGLMFMGSVMLYICSSSSCGQYSDGSGVKRVHGVLSGLRMRFFVCVHVCIFCRYDWMIAVAIFMSLCVDVIHIGREFYLCLWCWEFACGMYLSFWDVVFVCIENDVCEYGVCSV